MQGILQTPKSRIMATRDDDDDSVVLSDDIVLELKEDVELLMQKYDYEDQIESRLLNILMNTTSMPQEICINIIHYLPPQYKLIQINMIMYG